MKRLKHASLKDWLSSVPSEYEQQGFWLSQNTGEKVLKPIQSNLTAAVRFTNAGCSCDHRKVILI